MYEKIDDMAMNKEELVKMRIKRVEKEIKDTPYDKSSEHHIGKLRAKLAKLRDELDGAGKRSGGGGVGYAVRKEGDATIVLVGSPSVGKSTLLNALTDAKSKVAAYDFTTLGVIPGVMVHKGAKIQVLDVPGLIFGAAKGAGFGRKVLSVVRSADLVVMVTDWVKRKEMQKIEEELESAGIRLGKFPPKITIKKKDRGAIRVIDQYASFAPDTVMEVAGELGFRNAEIIISEKVSLDTLIDALSGNRKYIPILRVMNKIDEIGAERGLRSGNWIYLSAKGKSGLEVLREQIWRELKLVRVYMRPEKHKPADRDKPLIVQEGLTVIEALGQVSGELKLDIGKVYIWGKGAKFPGQQVSFTYPVFDEIEVYFSKKTKT